MTTKYIQLPVCKLSAFTASASTSFDVSGFLYNDGTTVVAAADIGDLCFATLEPKTAREELISFTIDSVTGAGVATITVVRGLSQKSPYGTGGASFDHQAGSDLVISNNPGLFNRMTAKDNDETVTGSWAFPLTPTTTTNPVTKGHFDDNVVKLTGNQTVAGEKTFSDPAVFSDTLTVIDAVADAEAPSKLQTETYVGTLDVANVKKTGDQTVDGIKTFSSSPKIPDATADDEAYTKGQHDADAVASSAIASPTVRGTAKLDAVADTPADPEVLTATADRVGAMAGGGDFGTPSATNKLVTEEFLLKNTIDVPVIEDKTYVSTPLLCSIRYGDAVLADIDTDGKRSSFCFISSSITPTKSTLVSSQRFTTSGTTFSETVGAGDNRVLIVVWRGTVLSTYPTTATWGGVSMTKIVEVSSNDTNDVSTAIWGIAIGDSVSTETDDITFDLSGKIDALTFDNMSQSDIAGNTSTAVGNDGGSSGRNDSNVDGYNGVSIKVFASMTNSGNTVTDTLTSGTSVFDGFISGAEHGRTAYSLCKPIGDGSELSGGISTSSTADATLAIILSVRTLFVETISSQNSGIVSGFTGLSKGQIYYASSTPGVISLTANIYPIGTALSATELLMF